MPDWDGPAFGVICAFEFPDGRAEPWEPAPADLAPPAAGWTWTHLRLGDVRAQAALKHCPDLPREALDLFLETETRIQVDHAEGWSFGVLPDLERDLSGRALGEGRLIFALDDRRLVTGRLSPLRAVDELRRRAERGEIEVAFDGLGDQIAGIEDHVLTEPANPQDIKLAVLRRALARPRRDLQALRAALVRAHTGRARPRTDLLGERFADIVTWIEDVDQNAAALQERGRLLHEEIDTLINSATNRSMRALTVISTLLIPPTLIVGAFGMNVPGIPFEHNPAGFALAMAGCVALVGGAVVLLRRMGLMG